MRAAQQQFENGQDPLLVSSDSSQNASLDLKAEVEHV